jgi:hypothetical protein
MLSYCFNLTDEPDAQSKEPLTYAIFEATSGVGLPERLNEPDAATRRGDGPSSGW